MALAFTCVHAKVGISLSEGTDHWNVYWGVAAFTPGIRSIRSANTTHREIKNDWYLIVSPLLAGLYLGCYHQPYYNIKGELCPHTRIAL
jgi:hypothetical protein